VEIRACTADDLGGVADLFVRAFRKGDQHSMPALRDYLRRLYLENPWVRDDLPSLVADHEGVVRGFIGVVPMPQRLDGRRIDVAVGGNLMVDRDVHDPMVASRLLRRYFAGPQDLAFTDTASDQAVKLWTALGGKVARFHTMRWFVPLRPGALGLAAARRHPVGARFAWAGRPFVWPVDKVAARRLAPDAGTDALVAATPARLHAFVASLSGCRALLPDLDLDGFRWLVDMCRAKQQFGPMKMMALTDAGADVGVVLYYPNRGGLGQVALMVARDGAHARLLDALLRDAALEGTAALMGQADPAFMNELGERTSVYIQRNEYVTLKGAAELTAPIASGDVAISRLCGDWWTRMQGDVF
jgi:hypothetical protein